METNCREPLLLLSEPSEPCNGFVLFTPYHCVGILYTGRSSTPDMTRGRNSISFHENVYEKRGMRDGFYVSSQRSVNGLNWTADSDTSLLF